MVWEWVVPDGEEDAVNKMERDAKQAEMTDVYPGNRDALPLIRVADLFSLLSSPFSLLPPLFSFLSLPPSPSLFPHVTFSATHPPARTLSHFTAHTSNHTEIVALNFSLKIQTWDSKWPSLVHENLLQSRSFLWTKQTLKKIIYHILLSTFYILSFKKNSFISVEIFTEEWKRNRCSSHCQL